MPPLPPHTTTTLKKQPSEWREVPFDGAPSRAGPAGGRWMQAIVEAPGPDARLHFFVRGPRPDLNDEWGSTAARGGGGGGNWAVSTLDGGGSGSGSGGGGADGGGAEDRPARANVSGGDASSGSGGVAGVAAGGGDGTSGGPYYTLPWPGGWKLERGAVAKFERALAGPVMLCSDVDGTFVTDKGDPWGDSRIADFRAYWCA